MRTLRCARDKRNRFQGLGLKAGHIWIDYRDVLSQCEKPQEYGFYPLADSPTSPEIRIEHRRREWMGVEPTKAASSAPLNDFEDRGAHRDSSTPTRICRIPLFVVCVKAQQRIHLRLQPLGKTGRPSAGQNRATPEHEHSHRQWCRSRRQCRAPGPRPTRQPQSG